MKAKDIELTELKDLLNGEHDLVLIDTALADDYLAKHIPGAQNACVFEVNFLEQMQASDGLHVNTLARLVGSENRKDAAIVVYGASERSLASTTAAEKLLAAGYQNVSDFRGGLATWCAAGLPFEGSGQVPANPPLEDRTYAVDAKLSAVEWTGRSLGGKHQGTINVMEGGTIDLRAGKVVGGALAIDMDSIADTDISNPLVRKVLHDHLKSDDFFDVAKFRLASFRLKDAMPIDGACAGQPNYRVNGLFTLKGVERPLGFNAQVGYSPENDGSLVARANFDLDRTGWNVLYGSGKFYERLGKHLVSDLITLDLKIVAR